VGLAGLEPKVVRHAVLFEPPLLAVVPQGQQMVAGMRAVIEPAMAEGGPRRAMEGFIRGNARRRGRRPVVRVARPYRA
jgi:hypothetical protein